MMTMWLILFFLAAGWLIWFAGIDGARQIAWGFTKPVLELAGACAFSLILFLILKHH